MQKTDAYRGLRDISLSKEKLEALARETAARSVRMDKRALKRSGVFDISGDRRALIALNARLDQLAEMGVELPIGAKSLMDAFYVIEKTAAALEASFDAKRRMPMVPVEAEGERVNLPRIYSIAIDIAGRRSGRVDTAALEAYLNAYQAVRPLTMRELSLLLSMLKLALIRLIRLEGEDMCERAEQYAMAEDAANRLCCMPRGSQRIKALIEKLDISSRPAMAERLMTLLLERDSYELIQSISQSISFGGNAAEELLARDRSLAELSAKRTLEATASLRYIDSIDAQSFFEKHSRVEQILREDSVYPLMDAASRDYYREQLEKTASRCGAGEAVAARMALELSAKASGKAAHIGYYLTEWEGQRQLLSALRPDKTFVYADEDARLAIALCTQGLIMLILVLLCSASGWIAALVSIIPAWCIARELTVRMAAMLHGPKRIPRLALENGIPDDAGVLVSVPVLITGERDIEQAVEQLETHYLANSYKNCYFAVIGDFVDSEFESLQGEDELIKIARAKTEALNKKYKPNGDGRNIFYFLHRKREFSKYDGMYMGHERKRGAILALTGLIVDADDEPFCLISSALPGNIKYCLTLDADTILPIGELKRLVGAMEHVLNQPEQDALGVVRSGYGVIVPRMRQSLTGAAKSRFAALVSPGNGVDIYSMLSGEYYQDVYGTGLFGGKGIFDVRCFRSALLNKISDNSVLSHDLLEGCFLRAGFAGDIVLYDEEPSAFLSWWKRQHRWIRGDWQLLPFIMPKLTDAAGTPYKNPLSALSRTKLASNMLSSLVPVSALICFMLMPYTNGGLYAALALLALCRGAVWELIGLIKRFVTARLDELDVRGAMEESRPALLNGVMQLAVLPYSALRTIDAIIRTIYRLTVSHKNMLQWQTAAQTKVKAGELKQYFIALWPCGLFAGIMILAGIFLGAMPACFILSALFISASVLIAYLDAPLNRETLNGRNSEYIKEAARRTWRFFETFCTEDTGFLPPDNYQKEPLGRAIPNTSPTNIGMAMLSSIAAQRLGFIDEKRLVEIIGKMCATMEKLEKWHGHLYNWYSIKTMTPLEPRYVSTVDSGNLAACLICAAEAVEACGDDELGKRLEKLYMEMDFTLLADDERKLFSIGYDCSSNSLSKGRYDLLASEARLTSFVAAALGQVSPEYYYSLSRLLTDVYTRRVLLSWGGTMFEYLMPVIFTGALYGSALGESAYNAVTVQRLSAKKGYPWGISESGFYAFDRNMLYQYRAFGERQLALCQESEEERVIAPYASMLALMIEPDAACANLKRLEALGAYGKFGFYEAVDFTRERMREGSSYEIVKSYMAHHQGMALCAAANALCENALSDIFLNAPRIRAAKMLLEEKRADRAAAIKRVKPKKENAHPESITPRPPRVSRADLEVYEAQHLTNGSYTVFACDNGISSSSRGGFDITRFHADEARFSSGVFFAIKSDEGCFSATLAPVNGEVEEYRCVLEPYRAVYERREGSIKTRLEVYVDSAHDAEVRLLSVTNAADSEKRIDIGAFLELALAKRAEYEAHPAFVRITVDANRAGRGVIFERRSVRGDTVWAYAALIDIFDIDGAKTEAVYTTDALISPGRGKNILEAMLTPAVGLCDISCPIEPELCARMSRQIEAKSTAKFAFILGAENSREEAEAAMGELIKTVNDVPDRAWAMAKREQSINRLDTGKLELFERIAARIELNIASKKTDAATGDIKGGIDILFRYGINPDMPLVLMKVSSQSETRMVKTLLELKAYLKRRNVSFELAFIGMYASEYHNDLRSRLEGLVRALGAGDAHIIHGFGLDEADEARLEALALIVIDPKRSLDKQFMPKHVRPLKLPPYGKKGERAALAPKGEPKELDNGIGGFEAGGSYVMKIEPGQTTPLPWVNIMANDSFGTIISESGGGYTWHGNSRQHKLTPWYNDPVRDPKGEFVMLMDKDDMSVWTVTPGRLSGNAPVTVRHGFGFSDYQSEAEGLSVKQRVFVDESESVKYILLDINNPMLATRRIRLFFGCDMVLGEKAHREACLTRLIKNAMTVTSLRNSSAQAAFISAIGMGAEYGDARYELLSGAWLTEEPLKLIGYAQGFMALRGDIELEAGESKRIALLLGEADADTIERLCSESIEAVESRLEKVTSSWRGRLGKIKIATPDRALDMLMNGRLVYQTLVSRVLGKTGYYQCGGATGFRDQLQDMLALVYYEPDRVRKHIIECAKRQFIAGDVLHWWHEPCCGVRTRISDDRLFLPYVACEYAKITGDGSIWDERCEYLEDVPIDAGARDIYCDMNKSSVSESIYMHCVRAIEASLSTGAHSLPLMGGGDWNDGMDNIGRNGGESVWLAFFTADVLGRFISIAEDRGDTERARRYKAEKEKLMLAAETAGWDGEWYKRAYLSDGSPIGGRENAYCRIDLLCQAWACIAGAENAQKAFDSAMGALVDFRHGTAALLTPAFSRPDEAIGYITAYVPGVRENGGQYTHAAAWLIKAACALNKPKEAKSLVSLINPIERTSSYEGMLSYMAEPYVAAGDVYTVARCKGRAGWTWYTGAAAWLYKTVLEDVLGFKKTGDKLYIQPCCEFEEYNIKYTFGETIYDITVKKGALSGAESGIQLADDKIKHSFVLYRQ